ncbi:MAG: hypothetical protein QW292_14540 [Candidatus Parvarchaeota archaeon]
MVESDNLETKTDKNGQNQDKNGQIQPDSIRKRERRYEKRKTEEQLISLAGISIEKLLDLTKEFLRAANSNPIIGMVTSLIVTDILYRTKIIDLPTAVAVNVMVGTIEGGSIAGQVIQDITDIMNFFGNRPSNIEFKPSATTIVYADSSNDSALIKSLLAREGVKG